MLRSIAIVFVLALAPVIAQEAGAQTEKKSVTQIFAEWREQDNKRDVERVAKAREAMEQEVQKYKDLLEVRKALSAKLQRALDDGDETLIQVAVSDIRSNTDDLKLQAEATLKWRSDALMQAARNAYSSPYRLITEEQYTGHLKFTRQAKVLTEQPAPKELVDLVAKAKEKLPHYFAILEQQGTKVL